ncbi:MAG: T9SS type A sorting domain-containing protein [Bacteroidetes bacterium]|nr:T9SS type A sorting domain-containing protein [Bacteroidota bacterium]
MRKFFLLIGLLILFQAGFSQAWIQRTNFGGVGRHRSSAFAIGNRGYVGLGHVNGNNINIAYKDWWSYDPSSDSWTQVADYPTLNYGAISFATSTRGYAGGGAFLGSEFYEYNPQTNTWTAIQNCPSTPGDQGCFVVNNKGYVIFANNLYEYDPATGNWTIKQSAPISFATWCVGFNVGASGYIKSGATLYEYKPLNDQWLLKSNFPGLATNSSGAFVRDGKAYIVTGFVGSLTNVTSEVWEYNPGNNVWSQMNDFPGTSRRFSVAFTINNRGYFGTGTNGINLNDFWELNDNVSVNDLSSTKVRVNAFPNPATAYVKFTIQGMNIEKAAEVRMYSASGELTDVVTVADQSCEILRNGKADGIYIYQVLLDGKTISTGKIIFGE